MIWNHDVFQSWEHCPGKCNTIIQLMLTIQYSEHLWDLLWQYRQLCVEKLYIIHTYRPQYTGQQHVVNLNVPTGRIILISTGFITCLFAVTDILFLYGGGGLRGWGWRGGWGFGGGGGGGVLQQWHCYKSPRRLNYLKCCATEEPWYIWAQRFANWLYQ